VSWRFPAVPAREYGQDVGDRVDAGRLGDGCCGAAGRDLFMGYVPARQDHDVRLSPVPPVLSTETGAIQPGHVPVEQNDVGMMPERDREGVSAIGCDKDVVVGVEDDRETV
jgi:hypothetical protein